METFELANYWHPTLNSKEFSEVHPGSPARAWWLGECGHEWDRVIREQVKFKTCPYCAGSRILPGFNDLATLRPDIAAEWHPTHNTSLPTETALQANTKVWWLCSLSHEYQANVANRTALNNGCPICANKKVLLGFNDLASQNPDVAKSWSSKNVRSPEDVTVSSHTKVQWECEEGHEWTTEVRKRTVRGQGCPVCSGNVVHIGFNDLASLHPELVKEWADTNPKPPTAYTAGNGRIMDWECKQGHTWKATIGNRVVHGSRCPKCVAGLAASKAEVAVGEYLESLSVEVDKNVRNIISPHEIDLYLPEYKIGVEFNGVYWHSEKHKPKNYHYDKWLAAKEAGVELVQIWEDEWNNNPELIKTMLARKLGLSAIAHYSHSVTEIITEKEAKIFMEVNHIQGFASGSYYLALKNKASKENLSVLVLDEEENNVFTVLRYAEATSTVDGLKILLQKAKELYSAENFVIFADHCNSDTKLYEENGFVVDEQLPPDYFYVVNNKRIKKENLTDTQLTKAINYNRIWDAGKTRYELRLL